ncbi:MAG: urea ABC transporter substrate-binding protein [Myxococcales bacterium]|nr:urea ABC transporter substrate-binding protein [Myxococcales bacterium]USN50033.1 MAG: urea ABC transporter substrate-binding protein [Myxococcales bacterium]
MKKILIILAVISIWGSLGGCNKSSEAENKKKIKVGVLHSETGSMATVERPVLAATLRAIDAINQAGGILGRSVEAVVRDGRSDEKYFSQMAKELIEKEKVSAIFGCWTSSSRKAVKEVVEDYAHLLIYPLQYEGVEQSKYIFYIGMTANQQIIPAIAWMIKQNGPKVYVVGSDYVFPRVAFEIIKDTLKSFDGQLVGSSFVPLGSKDVRQPIDEIKKLKPDVILNLINGDTNLVFFSALREQGITPDVIPTMSFSITEEEVRLLGHGSMVGDYTTWSYFQSIKSKENVEFLDSLKQAINPELKVFDPMESAFSGVRLWHQAVVSAKSWQPEDVREALKGQSLLAPSGVIYIDPNTQHAWRTIRIAQINNKGDFGVLWSSQMPIEPVPFISTRPKEQWSKLLENLFEGWGGQWSLKIQ